MVKGTRYRRCAITQLILLIFSATLSMWYFQLKWLSSKTLRYFTWSLHSREVRMWLLLSNIRILTEWSILRWWGRKITKFDFLAFNVGLFALSQSETLTSSLLTVFSRDLRFCQHSTKLCHLQKGKTKISLKNKTLQPTYGLGLPGTYNTFHSGKK